MVTDGFVRLIHSELPHLTERTVRDVLLTALATGACAGAEDLLPGGDDCLPLWTDLAVALRSRGGWRPAMSWPVGLPATFMFVSVEAVDGVEDEGPSLSVEGFGDGSVKVVCQRPPDDPEGEWVLRYRATAAEAVAWLDAGMPDTD